MEEEASQGGLPQRSNKWFRNGSKGGVANKGALEKAAGVGSATTPAGGSSGGVRQARSSRERMAVGEASRKRSRGRGGNAGESYFTDAPATLFGGKRHSLQTAMEEGMPELMPGQSAPMKWPDGGSGINAPKFAPVPPGLSEEQKDEYFKPPAPGEVEDPQRKELRLMRETMKETLRDAHDLTQVGNASTSVALKHRPKSERWRHTECCPFTDYAGSKKAVFSWAEKKSTAHHIYISHKYKLMITTVPKVACTEFMRVIARMNGDKKWKLDPHFRTTRPTLAQLPFGDPVKDQGIEAAAILNDPRWTKAVFFRDPAERLLSAYIDKFVRNNKYSLIIFKEKRRVLRFDEFVERATACVGDDECRKYQVQTYNRNGLPMEGLHSKTNPHWRPQVLVANLESYLHIHDFVGNFSHLGEHTFELLDGVGAWEEHGSSGWGSRGKEALFDRNHAMHRTAASNDKKQDSYYTPELLAKVKEAYKADYALLDLLGTTRTSAPVTGRPFAGKTLVDLDPRLVSSSGIVGVRNMFRKRKGQAGGKHRRQ